MEQRFDALTTADKMSKDVSDKARFAVIGTTYDDLFASVRTSQALGGVNDHDLDLLYRAARLTAFYTIYEKHTRDMALFLDELQARRLASKTHYVQMYKQFVKARMLTEARELARQHPLPELEILPELHEAGILVAGQPTELAVDPNKHELQRRSVDLHQPVQVVVVAHPLCHFSQGAMQEIQTDPVLSKVLGAHAKWLAPQDARFDFDVLQEWNREHPEMEITVTFRYEEWPVIDDWGTPTFYFLENGAVSAKVAGWPKGGRRAELLAALRQVGLLP